MNTKKEVNFSYSQLVTSVILTFIKDNKSHIIGYTILLLIGTTLSVVGITKLSAKLYKSVSAADKKASIRLLVLIICVSLLVTLVNFGIDRFEGIIAPAFRRYVKIRLISKVFEKNRQKYLDSILPIRYRSFVSATSHSTYNLFNNIIRVYVPNCILLVIMMAFLLYLNWKYFLVFFICMLLCILIFWLRKNFVLQLSETAELQQRKSDAFIFDVLSSIQTVIGRDSVNKELASIKKQVKVAEKMHRRQNHRTDDLNYSINALVAVSIFIIMGLAVSSIKDKQPVNSVQILAALSLMGTLRNKLTGLSSTNIAAMGEYARGNANQLPILDEIKSDVIRHDVINKPIHLEFRNVSFGYTTGNRIIKNFNWDLQPGEISALRARSGKGKSTLAKLVLQFYQPSEGTIFINNKPISTYNIANLRTNILFINQDIPLLNRSILENLQYATKATRQDVLKLWEPLAHYFKGKGLTTKIGKNGNSLSTGQKQLIRIINSVLSSHAQLIIYDEPCANLNEELREIVKALINQAASQDKTVWLITHDDDVITIADKVTEL